MSANPDLEKLIETIRAFMAARDWEQFHSPKNLSMALSVEAAELMEHFQWLTMDESRDLSPETLARVRDEVGDVMVYLLRLCDVLGIDPVAAASEKMIKNGEKYPVEKARGNARKYTDL
ncbi:MAG: nucleotide pyrophosphohydrolase [Candidatus Marinimicrobia bacterium]|nr:nucleotide pyrophosphohydrolase [Candidatus Neomarinimicrobiota bacterium]MCF7839871.1 nucleotide pyrophosphohydrolase [Candidatus Neomarinimicrobiota bacterium]